ncbi:Uma2 family endonuclease [bacterium]|nr:Uma2 family endonuclease [bacterium]
MSTATVPQRFISAEEFRTLKSAHPHSELIAGRVIEMPSPGFLHGLVCAQIIIELGFYLRTNRSGRVISNDSGVITERNPDTVRGPDVAYYSFTKLPTDQSPEGYPEVPPDLVFEVKSPSDRWTDLLKKVSELLTVGVNTVCVIDPERELAQIFRSDEPVQLVAADSVLEFASLLPGWSVPLKSLLSK